MAVGASGSAGLIDMEHLLAGLPASFPGTILFTLHRPVDRPSNLATVLERVSALPVAVARDRQPLRSGTCYVGEPAAHLALGAPATIGLVADPRHAYRNRTIDLLFASVAAHAGASAIGVVLSGSLADGSRGLGALRQAGGVGMARTPLLDCRGDMPRNAMARSGPLEYVDHVEGLIQAILALGMLTDAASEWPGSTHRRASPEGRHTATDLVTNRVVEAGLPPGLPHGGRGSQGAARMMHISISVSQRENRTRPERGDEPESP